LFRIAGRLDAVRDTINTAIQVTLSMVAIDENDISKKLASYAAIFAVVTSFAAVWGMNFEFMPELKWKYGYPCALSIMLGVCGRLYWRFKKSGWI
jgi:magnesium transporter